MTEAPLRLGSWEMTAKLCRRSIRVTGDARKAVAYDGCIWKEENARIISIE